MYSEKGLKHLVKYNSNLGSMLTQPYNSKNFNSNATESILYGNFRANKPLSKKTMPWVIY